MYKDQWWNTLRFRKTKTRFSFVLSLPSNKHKVFRVIAYHKIKNKEVDKSVLYIKRKRQYHFMRKVQGYWFNDKMLRTVNPDTKIVIFLSDCLYNLETTAREILESQNATYLTFKWQWLETQVFMKEDDFKKLSKPVPKMKIWVPEYEVNF